MMDFDFAPIDRAFEALHSIDDALGRTSRRIAGKELSRTIAPTPFWARPGGLELDSVRYDHGDEEFVVTFVAGPTYHLPRRFVRDKEVRGTELDEFRHGVVVLFDDLEVTSFAGDLVLFHCEPAYKASVKTSASRSARSPIGARVRRERLAKGLSLTDVARAVDMAASNYSRLESGAHGPRLDVLMRVAEALGVPLTRLTSPRRRKSRDGVRTRRVRDG